MAFPNDNGSVRAAASTVEDAVTRSIAIDQDIVQLAKLLATKCLQRNLATEDEAIKRDYEKGSGGPPFNQHGREDMEITVAGGDVHIYERPPQQEVPPVEIPPDTDTVAGTSLLPPAVPGPTSTTVIREQLPTWIKTAAITAVLGSGVGAATGIAAWLNSGKTTPVTNITQGDDTIAGTGLLPPARPEK